MCGSDLKKRTLVRGQGGCKIQTGGILAYFKAINFASNDEIGPKVFFATASKQYVGMIAYHVKEPANGCP